MMGISIIIPTKNCKLLLKDCLESIKRQTYKDYEVIVSDNLSTDGTVELAKEYNADVLSIPGKGDNRVVQRNEAAKKARFNRILFIDSDMVLSENVLLALSKVKSDCAFIPEQSFGRGFWAKARAFGRSMHELNTRLNAARYFRKDLFLKVGGYDEELIVMEDVDLTYRLRKAGASFEKISELIYHNEGHLTLFKAIKKKFNYGRTLHRYIRKHRHFSKTHTKLFRSVYFHDKRLLLRHPLLTLGFFFMRVCEFSAAALSYKLTQIGVLKDKFGKRRILIVFGHAIGDNIMLSPVIRQLRADYPNAYIALAGLKYLPIRELWQYNPRINHYEDLNINYNPRFWNPVMFYLVDYWRLRREASKLKKKLNAYEVYIIRIRKFFTPKQHKTKLIASELGIKVEDMAPELFLDKIHYKKAREFLNQHNLSESDLIIGLHRTAGDYKRRAWSIDEAQKFIDNFPEAKFIVFNSTQSYKDEERYEQKHLHGRNLISIPIPSPPLLVSAALISYCKVFIGTDSGLAHIASALKVPTLVLFRNVSPSYALPYNAIPLKDLSYKNVLFHTKKLLATHQINHNTNRYNKL